MKTTDKEPDTTDAAELDAHDLLLIEEMLALSPDERLQQLESMAALAQELRDANPALRVSQDT